MNAAEKEVRDILEGFTIPQLQALQLSTRRSGEPQLNLNKERLIAILRGGTELEGLALAAHRLEAVSPYKHVYLCAIRKPRLDTISRLQNAYGNLGESFEPANLSSGAVQPQTCVFHPSMNRIYLKFVHVIETVQWVKTDDENKKEETISATSSGSCHISAL